MKFQRPLARGRLLRRWNRFLSEVEIDGTVHRAHCPNPGAMTGLNAPGTTIWAEPNDDPKRKLNWAWRLVELPGGHMAGIDTSVPNRVVHEALAERRIPAFADYPVIRPEQRYAEKSRVDFLLSGAGPDLYLEVKNVHLRRTGELAEFPDSVTARGARHLIDLSRMVAEGHRAAMLYVVQRTDCPGGLRLARDIDPAYGRAFDAAVAAGVEVHVWGCTVTTDDIALGDPLPCLE